MPLTIELQLPNEACWRELPLDVVKSAIASGEFGPQVLVRDRVLTNSECWTLDNLNLFHRLAPRSWPPGQHLHAKRQRRDKQIDELQLSLEWGGKVEDSLPSDFCSACWGLVPLTDLLRKPDAEGVARIIRSPFFTATTGVTLVYCGDYVEVQLFASVRPHEVLVEPVAARRDSQIPDWRALAEDFATRCVRRLFDEVPSHTLPPPLNDWHTFRQSLDEAPSCSEPCLDGCGYTVEAADAHWNANVSWNNPHRDRTPNQWRLVEAFNAFLTATP